MSFITPRTDWIKGDPVNITDYNRVLNNSKYLYEKLKMIYASVAPIVYGSDKAVEDWYFADEFNKFEDTLATVETATGLDFGDNIQFYDNGLFISAEEMLRIESAHIEINDFLDMIIKMRYHLAFRFGAKASTIRC